MGGMRTAGTGRGQDRAEARRTAAGRRGDAAARERARAKGKAALVAGAAGVALAVLLSGCGSGNAQGGGGDSASERATAKADRAHRPARTEGLTEIPGVGSRLQGRIPEDSRQVVAVEGKGEDSADAVVRLYTRAGNGTWKRAHSWPAHNGKNGWTHHHHEGDKRSPVGVFSLSDAGGVLPDPGAKLPYAHSAAFTPPTYWPKKTRNDFDYVIAINYNRVKGTTPLDPTRPQGQAKGGSIWLHRDHGDGTSGCVSVSKAGMRTLLRTLDPDKHPVVVMGDKASLSG